MTNTIVLVVDNQTDFLAQVTKMSTRVTNFHQTGWSKDYIIYQFDIEEGALEAWRKTTDNTRGYARYRVYTAEQQAIIDENPNMSLDERLTLVSTWPFVGKGIDE